MTIPYNTALLFKKVENLEEAELLRKIRNKCRSYMTRHTAHISSKEQAAWFETARDKYDLFIVYAIEYGAAVVYAGYGVIHKNSQESLLTGGLIPEYRNKGLGHNLFKFLMENCREGMPIRLEVLRSNTRAYKIYERLGFKIINEDPAIITMEYQYDSVI